MKDKEKISLFEKIAFIRFMKRHNFKSVFEPRKKDGLLALHWAAMRNAFDHMVEILRLHPTAISLTDKDGNTPLHIAAMYGNVKIVKYLIAKYPELVTIKNKDGLLPLHMAIAYDYNTDITERLIDEEPKTLKEPANNGLVPLHIAVSRDKDNVCQRILREYPDQIYAKDKTGATPLAKIARKRSRSAKLIMEQDLVGTFNDLPEYIFEQKAGKNGTILKNILSVVDMILEERYPDRENITEEENKIRAAINKKCEKERKAIAEKFAGATKN